MEEVKVSVEHAPLRVGFQSEEAAMFAADKARKALSGVQVVGWAAMEAPGGGWYANIGLTRGKSVKVWPMEPRTADMMAVVEAELWLGPRTPNGIGQAQLDLGRKPVEQISKNPCRWESCRRNFPDRIGGCAASSCGVD